MKKSNEVKLSCSYSNLRPLLSSFRHMIAFLGLTYFLTLRFLKPGAFFLLNLSILPRIIKFYHSYHKLVQNQWCHLINRSAYIFELLITEEILLRKFN